MVDQFYELHLGTPNFIAVHARGSDKVGKVSKRNEINGHYRETIDCYLVTNPGDRIFLMTDDVRILDYVVGGNVFHMPDPFIYHW